MKNSIYPFYLKLACVLIILMSIGYLAIIGKEVLLPLLFSFLIAVLLLPLSNLLENKLSLPRAAASSLSVLLFLVVTSFIVYLMGSQIASLRNEWPLVQSQLSALFHTIQQWLQATFNINLQNQSAYISTATQKALGSSGGLIEKTVFSLSGFLLLLIFILIYTLLLLLYRRLLMRFIVAVFTEKYKEVIFDIAERIKYIFRKYITGLFIEMAIVLCLACFIFWLIGVQYVLLLGLLVAVFNLIPYVGIFTALFISAGITYATFDGRHALYVIIAVVSIHLLDSNILMPKIVGSQVKVNPLIIILGVVIGELMWGIPGMFLSIPYIAMAKIIMERVEGLQPWGLLLGEDEKTSTKGKKFMFSFRKKAKK